MKLNAVAKMQGIILFVLDYLAHISLKLLDGVADGFCLSNLLLRLRMLPHLLV